jgi:hypothetical protein
MQRGIGIGHNHPPANEPLPIHVDAKDHNAAKTALTLSKDHVREMGHANKAASDDLSAEMTAARRLPTDFSAKAAAREAERQLTKHHKARRQSRTALRLALQELFGLYVYTAAKSKRIKNLKSNCIEAKMNIKANTPLAVLIVRYYGSKIEDATVSRYADVLREAARRNVNPNKLATYLEGKDQGIDALSRSYQERGTDGGATVVTRITSKSRAMTSDAANITHRGRKATLSWPATKAEKFESAPTGKKFRILMEKIDANHYRVVRTLRRSPKKIEP